MRDFFGSKFFVLGLFCFQMVGSRWFFVHRAGFKTGHWMLVVFGRSTHLTFQ